MVAPAVNDAVARAARQQRQAADPNGSAWVAANAGSGKTTVLANRVLALLLTGAKAEHILCLTYTKAATAEMRIRIGRTLAEWSVARDAELKDQIRGIGLPPPSPGQLELARQLFARTIDSHIGIRIDTIHAFCQGVLGRFPLEARVAPHFLVADDRERFVLQHQARDNVLRSGDAGTREAIEVVADHLPDTAVDGFLSDLLTRRDRMGPGALGQLRSVLAVPEIPPPAPGRREAAEILLASGKSTDRNRGADLIAWIEDEEANLGRGRKVFFDTKGAARKRISTASLPEGDRVEELLRPEMEHFKAVRERELILTTLATTEAAVTMGRSVETTFTRLKRMAGLLDYDDLIRYTRNLLSNQPGTWVHYKLDDGIRHVLIDEAQDTSQEQWEVIRSLTADFFAGEGASEETRTVFAVGDTKQSIYRFQGAEPKLFDVMRKDFGKRVKGSGGTWAEIPLEVSFRSAPTILRAIDLVFADKGWPPHRAARDTAGGRVEIWPLEFRTQAEATDPFEPPRFYGKSGDPETELARKVAGQIARWLENGEPVAPGGRPMRPGDIMVLLPRRANRRFFPEAIAALKDHGVPVAGIDRMQLLEELAAQDLAAIGDFVLLPRDDLTLAAVLKGPLFGLDDDALFHLAHERTGSLWRMLGDRRGDPRFSESRKVLESLLSRADFTSPFEFFADLLAHGGLRTRILERLGNEANDPVDEFLAAALEYEALHPPSLQGFLHWLRSGNAEVKRFLGQDGHDEVRIGTIHGAKGLEAPVVILPDTDSPENVGTTLLDLDDEEKGVRLALWPPSTAQDQLDPVSMAAKERHVTDTREEYLRLLYVAMTRAADRLVVCGWTGKPEPKPSPGRWYERISEALAPFLRDEDRSADPVGATIRVMEVAASEASTDRRAEEAPEVPVLPDWARTPLAAPAAAAAGRPSDDDDIPVISPLTGAAANRFRRGLIVHKLLELLPELPPSRRPSAARSFVSHEREFAAEAEALVSEVLGVLDHPEFAPVFAPGSRAEVPVVGMIDGAVVNARIDRLAFGGRETLIVDFKSQRPAPTTVAKVPAAYLRQLAQYVRLVGEIRPEVPVRAALLWTEAPILMPIPAERFAPYLP